MNSEGETKREHHKLEATAGLLSHGEGRDVHSCGQTSGHSGGAGGGGRTWEWSLLTTYTVAFATWRTLGPGQTSVSLLSLLTRWSDQADQTWMTLKDKNIQVNSKLSKLHI